MIVFRKISFLTAFTLGFLVWTVCLQSASANVYTVSADVSIGVHVGNNSTFDLGDPCTITKDGKHNVGAATDTNYMLVRFDFTGWPADPGVTSVKLRLTRSSGDIPSSSPPYTVSARGFYPANYDWYLDPENVTGNYQYYNDGVGDIPWKKSDGSLGTIEEAGYDYLGGGSTWDSDTGNTTLEISLNAANVQDWIRGQTSNNGLRLDSNRSISPYFYGSGATNAADRPTLIIEASVPEPASLAVLGIGAFGLVAKRRRQTRL